MSNASEQPLLKYCYDEEDSKSKWDHFQILSRNIAKNINWPITISAFVITVVLSVITSNIITERMNQYVAPRQFHHYGMNV